MEASFPAGWKYRQKLVCDEWQTNYADIANQPILLIWTGTAGTSNLPAAMFDTDLTPARSDGGDIRFTSDKWGSVPIPFEVVSFNTASDPSTVTAEIWVNIPTVYYRMNTPFYVWWGNANANRLLPTDTYGWYNTWRSGCKMCLHLQASGTPWYDSTVNAVGDTSRSNVAQGTGKIQKGLVYSSASATAYLAYASSTALNQTAAITVSAWVNATNWSSNRRIAQKGADSQYALLCESGNLTFKLVGTTGTNPTATLPSTGAWHLIHGVYNGATSKIYVDGAEVASQAMTGSIATSATDLDVGHKPGSGANGDSMLGTIDEFRVWGEALSADEIYNEYTSQNAPQTFIIQGAVETLGTMTGWKRKCALTQDRTKLGGDEVDLVVPFVWTGSQATSNLPQEMMEADSGYAAKSDGSDVRFSQDVNGVRQLSVEIAQFSTNNDPSVARAEIYVRVRSLSSAANTTIYVWYNNSSASAIGLNDANGQRDCWAGTTEKFSEVFHMNNDGATGYTRTSTKNVYDLQIFNSTEADGKLGKCQVLNGSTAYLQGTYNTLITGSEARTLSYWVKRNNRSLEVGWGTNASAGEFWGWAASGGGNYGIWGWAYDVNTGVASTTGSWEQIVIAYTATSANMYVNGSQVGATYNTTYNTTTAPMMVGKAVDGASTYWLDGSVDEIRIIAGSKMAATRITSYYNSQNSPQTFWSVGTADSLIFPNGWRYVVKLTQDHTKVDTENVDNFVSLLAWTGSAGTSCLPATMFDADGPAAANSDGSDIRITSDSAGATQIPFEIVLFTTDNDPANGRAEIYVRVPQVQTASDVNIYVWWGNSAAVAYLTTDIYGRNSVWPDYLMVLHFQSTTLTDSTGNGYDAANTNITTTAGPLVGNAGNFNGTTAFATPAVIPATVPWSYWNAWYITAWMNYTATGAWSRMFEFANTSGGAESLLFANNGTSTTSHIRYTSGAYTVTNEQATNITLSQWDLHGYLFNGSNLYTVKNGAQIGSPTAVSTAPSNIARTALIGKSVWSAGDALYSGKMDEFRVRKGIGTNHFRTTDYNSSASPNTFWGLSTVEMRGWVIDINVTGTNTWKKITKVFVTFDSSTWKAIKNMDIIIGGAWKDHV